MRKGDDLLNSALYVQRGGFPTHRVGDFSENISNLRTGSHSGPDSPVEVEAEVTLGCAVFSDVRARKLHAFLTRHLSAPDCDQVLTVAYEVALSAIASQGARMKPTDFLKRVALPVCADISASWDFVVTPSLVRDGRTVVEVQFALRSKAHANKCADTAPLGDV